MRPQIRHILRTHNRPHIPTPLPLPTSKITPFTQSHPYTTSLTSQPSQRPNLSSPPPNSYNLLVGLFSDTTSVEYRQNREELSRKVSILKDELVKHKGDVENVHKVLQDLGLPLFTSYTRGAAFVELLRQLTDSPILAVEVFNWRRKQADIRFPITPEEYAKGITIAGRARDVNLAVEVFTEAVNNRVKTPSTYNALMGAYMVNCMYEKCQSLFEEFKKEATCSPTIVTYNILISVFARLMLIDHMEATLEEIYDSYLTPNLSTFNNLMTGYVTAWMWDRMEETYNLLKERHIEPDVHTYKLLVRGYAHCGNLKKMEQMYELLKQHSYEDSLHLTRAMICAYCKSPCANRIEKIDTLMQLIPDQENRSWLIALLIKVYAEENVVEKMEQYIDVAFENQTAIRNVTVMRLITTAYFNSCAVDKLSCFVERAESAGWRLCRSLYHARMVLYGTQNRLKEMENVVGEMEKVNIDSRTMKTLVIMYKAYATWGLSRRLEQVIGLMYKLGLPIREDTIPLY